MVEGKRSFLRSRPPSHPFWRASFATVGLGLGVGLLIARGEATDTALTSKQLRNLLEFGEPQLRTGGRASGAGASTWMGFGWNSVGERGIVACPEGSQDVARFAG